MPLTFVTGNNKKWEEFQAIFKSDAYQIERASLDLLEVQGTLEQVAMAKCKEASLIIKGPVITEDTALVFDAMGGLPGPYIKWFLDAVGLEGLNRMLSGFESKGAKAVCTFAYCANPASEPVLFQGVTNVSGPRPARQNCSHCPHQFSI